ncbi:MAG: sterol desaturase family protein [Hyphomonadaceae bacterium]|nr:sterol desaturase family protein [Hyphomonadaceae bacterium]
MRLAIRYLAYPLVMGIVFIGAVTLAASPGAAVALPILTLAGVLTVGGLEWLSPYQTAWTKSQGDVWADLQYNVLGAVLIQASVHFIYPLSATTVSLGVWPIAWPLWASVLGVGVIIDFGLYWMHRWSHRSPLLWRFHQPHHSPERLYWLNGERRHVVSALILATPGLVAVALLGAPQAALAGWFSILPVHLAFQHANIDYSLGPARRLFGVAEMHRWHHKRDYEDAQVNFGEVFLVWDWLFGSLHDARENIEAGDLGLSDATYPKGFFTQHAAPFDPRR